MQVALQFPDVLLGDSFSVLTKLEQQLPDMSFYVLADTSYGSCCVDLVAAQHYRLDQSVNYFEMKIFKKIVIYSGNDDCYHLL